MAKVGINGFGRIGRQFLRAAVQKQSVCVTAINDPFIELDYMVYMLKYDSVHGRFPMHVEMVDGRLSVNGNLINVYHKRDPATVPWDEAAAVYVLECSGNVKTFVAAQEHLAYNKSRKVILASNVPGVPILIYGVNHSAYSPNMNVVSAGAGSTNCLAPLLKVLHDDFGVKEALVTTIHSIISSQKVVDAPFSECWRSGRGAGQNIIPHSTKDVQCIEKVIPEMKGRVKGTEFQVPTPDVSALDLTCIMENAVKFADVKKAICEATENKYKGVLAFTNAQVVSTDYRSQSESCVVDLDASMMLSETFLKVIAWFDNEYGFSCRLVDLISHMYSVENPKW